MKKLLSTLLISTVVFGGVSAVSADQTITGETTADIAVKGTLGADNTDPDTTIPETDKEWINVTVPTETIFYNKKDVATIVSPEYSIVNNSGRPVKVSINSFSANSTNPTGLPGDYNLNLLVTGPATGNPATTASTSLISGGILNAPTNELITLANSADQYAKNDPLAPAGYAVKNKAIFKYDGSATATTALKLNYTLSLKFDSIGF
ncbi:hypothetical protein [Pseudolactococcus reticulitermitis]|uniref:WxL domain-containing protein n=1 Tax=Pseudolactococcus reticulitermitis TaxID=2025039 RepID=A0A224WVZ9_9LACT|nr:hypothetical protein [Lactococcus reticulitermitis]GAX46507.1 hypothetical protein RsY01_86 [Lactococcus reticulitermitis]